MANIASQKKRNRRTITQTQANIRFGSAIKTLFRSVEDAAEAGDGEALSARARELEKTIDKAEARNVLHRNTAARRKRRLARILAGAAS